MCLVAVRTVSTEDHSLPIGITEIVIVEENAYMAAAIRSDLCMALLTELRALFGEQKAVIRPMGTVAQAAIFSDRVMLPQVRTALLGMTIVTVVIQAQLLQHEGAE